jgi:hypothetical protein
LSFDGASIFSSSLLEMITVVEDNLEEDEVPDAADDEEVGANFVELEEIVNEKSAGCFSSSSFLPSFGFWHSFCGGH